MIRTAPGEVAYIWVLSAAPMRKGIMLDSGAAMSVCLVDYFPECGIELQAADGSPVEHYVSKDVPTWWATRR